MKLFNIFKKNEKKQIKVLDNECKKILNTIFFNCRFQFGREFTDIENLKNELLNNIENSNVIQKKIAVKILELIKMYFKLINLYISIKDSDKKSDVINLKERLDEVNKYIFKLNLQFYLVSDDVISEETNDLINEALVLKSVIETNYKNKKAK
jgi:hypothetical protein